MTTTPDFRTELARLVDLYYALGGNWSPHGYTDTWNDALTSARAALATPPPKPPADGEVSELMRCLADSLSSFKITQDPAIYPADHWSRRAATLLEQLSVPTPPPEPPKNCWLDDEPDMFPSPCVFDDPDEVINNCTYARAIKCKTDCKYYRVAAHPEPVQAPPPEPPKAPTDEDIHNFIQTRWHYRMANESPFGCSDYDGSRATQAGIDDVRAALERWGHG